MQIYENFKYVRRTNNKWSKFWCFYVSFERNNSSSQIVISNIIILYFVAHNATLYPVILAVHPFDLSTQFSQPVKKVKLQSFVELFLASVNFSELCWTFLNFCELFFCELFELWSALLFHSCFFSKIVFKLWCAV